MKKQIGKPLMQKWKNKIGVRLSALDKKKLVLTNLPYALAAFYADRAFFLVRPKPCLPLWSFSLIRKTELWKTNKPPAMQVSQHCFSFQKKTSGVIINVGSPTALIYTGGIHMDNNSLSHTKWNCKYHIVLHQNIEEK